MAVTKTKAPAKAKATTSAKAKAKAIPTTDTFIKRTPTIKSGKNLVIVESPAKCATIGKYLGKDFTVMASYGHISALAKKNMGIDIDNGYTPAYEIDPDKKKVVSALKSAMKQADQVWIATDEDREGEAIGRHVAQALNLNVSTTPRITFHEITKPALEHAVAHPRTLDMNLVNAQQARRVLDRLVGFELSPLLRKKIKAWLSAGRVQSVAVRLIVDREKEIQAFIPTPTIQLSASFATDQGSFIAKADESYSDINDAKQVLTQASESTFSVSSVVAKPTKKSPSAPFTTSTLQQEASRKLRLFCLADDACRAEVIRIRGDNVYENWLYRYVWYCNSQRNPSDRVTFWIWYGFSQKICQQKILCTRSTRMYPSDRFF
jgi:reverse gyrase